MRHFLKWGKGFAGEFMVVCPCSRGVLGLGEEPSPLGFGPSFHPWENFSFCIERTKGFTPSMQDRAANALTFRHCPGSPDLPRLHVSSGWSVGWNWTGTTWTHSGVSVTLTTSHRCVASQGIVPNKSSWRFSQDASTCPCLSPAVPGEVSLLVSPQVSSNLLHRLASTI